MVIDGIVYQIINILMFLMMQAGPTPVAGTNGTTAAFLSGRLAPAHIARLR